jgi:hypothetical protein
LRESTGKGTYKIPVNVWYDFGSINNVPFFFATGTRLVFPWYAHDTRILKNAVFFIKNLYFLFVYNIKVSVTVKKNNKVTTSFFLNESPLDLFIHLLKMNRFNPKEISRLSFYSY